MEQSNADVVKLRLYISKKIKSIYAGSFSSRSKSLRGFDLQEKRRFDIGDDPRAINISSTIKSGEFVVSVRKAERAANIIFAIDRSPSFLFSSVRDLKSNYALNLVKMISVACLGGGNRVKLLAFTDRIEYESHFIFTSQRIGQEIDDVARIKPRTGITDFKVILKRLEEVLCGENLHNRPSLIFVISDFLFEVNYLRELRNTAEFADFVAVIIKDPCEVNLPVLRGGFMRLVDPETQRVIVARKTSDILNRTIDVLKKINADYMVTMNSTGYDESLEKLANLFEEKR